MASEASIQNFVHALEEGGWAKKLRYILVVVAIFGMATFLIFSRFRGLTHADGMDQAQLAREIGNGNGFTTKFIRPFVIWQLQQNEVEFSKEHFPDTYHAPLHAVALAGPIKLFGNEINVLASERDPFLHNDRIIAITETIFFLLSLVILFFIGSRLFDKQLAIIGCSLIFLCDIYWQYIFSGLPQLLMLLLFSAAIYSYIRATELEIEGTSAFKWWVATGICFGLLALTHGITIWVFAGLLVATAIFSKQRSSAILIMLGIFFLMYGPWMFRMYQVSGSPFGTAIYAAYDQLGTNSKSLVMRTMDAPEPVVVRLLSLKIQTQIMNVFQEIYKYLGLLIPAPLFVLAFLQVFKRPVLARFRWIILFMFVFALLGIGIFGIEQGVVASNDLFILLIPFMVFYGLAILYTLWARLQLPSKTLRAGFTSLIILLSCFPMAVTLLRGASLRFNWPPYAPSTLAYIGQWVKKEEVVSSDQAWAVAWYTNRRTVLVPRSIKSFLDISDYGYGGGPIVGLLFSPISGDKPFMAEIVKGEYKEWKDFISRKPGEAPEKIPLTSAIPLPPAGEYLYFSDYPRWNTTK